MVMVDEACDTVQYCPGEDGGDERCPLDLATKVVEKITECLKKKAQTATSVAKFEKTA